MPYLVLDRLNGLALLGLYGWHADEGVNENTRPEVRRCPGCHTATHPYEEGFLESRKPGKAITSSIDGFQVVSAKVRSFFETNGVENVEYFPLPSGYFVMRPKRSVFFDLSENDLYYVGICKTCGRVTGRLIRYPATNNLMAGQPSIGELDVLNGLPGLGEPLASTLVIGDGLYAKMVEAKFTGVDEYWPVDQPKKHQIGAGERAEPLLKMWNLQPDE